MGNSGDIALSTTDQVNGSTQAVIMVRGAGAKGENEAGGTVSLVSTITPIGAGGMADYPLMWYRNTAYTMLAAKGGEVVNDKDATITLHGTELYGVAASMRTAENNGTIYLDGMLPTFDSAGNITSETYWVPPAPYVASAAMVAGSSDTGHDATAINTGTITVNNAGFGMMALNGGTAINQGTITLTADDGVTASADNQLVGMAAFNGGTVINDTTGTINIYANNSYAFSVEGSERSASLQGAAGQSFNVDDGQKGGGVNGMATAGVKYSSNETALHLDAYQWKEDGISDKGFMLNVKKTFR